MILTSGVVKVDYFKFSHKKLALKYIRASKPKEKPKKTKQGQRSQYINELLKVGKKHTNRRAPVIIARIRYFEVPSLCPL